MYALGYFDGIELRMDELTFESYREASAARGMKQDDANIASDGTVDVVIFNLTVAMPLDSYKVFKQ